MGTLGTPRNIDQLLTALRPDSSPSLVWYGPGGERVELSGRVVDNWVAKTANLLTEEFDAGPGTVVRLEMPPHWRSIVWALATWQVGACLSIGGSTPADIVATTDPLHPAEDAWPARAQLVAVAPGALQLRWDGELPDGVMDYAAEVRAFADYFADPAALDPAAAALEHPGGTISFGELLPPAETGGTSGPRHLLLPAAAGWTTVLAETLATWLASGTVVLVHPEVEVTARLLESERIDTQL
ncbi:TIGR03089 family protein [Arthrobacter sp. I2-34]|uniref:TIGR03089 family protein n=1 Tax=Arthrobacter hankyongi TaxID=2904801 RepID=A0ABS9L1P5_9MICC|nr:TIGR03089 family protein [Arthrobacter hankyongi]MCG2620595.1 TIGR03089 family protein [Arthrobacter hankyongi]